MLFLITIINLSSCVSIYIKIVLHNDLVTFRNQSRIPSSYGIGITPAPTPPPCAHIGATNVQTSVSGS